jgi:hypothetical protein
LKPTAPQLGIIPLLLAALPAAGHHSPAAFDMSKDVVLEGTVTEISWRNPHVYFGVETIGPDGESVVRQIEAGPPSNLATLGMNADTIKAGERVVVRVKPNRSAADGVVLGFLLTSADGTEFPLHVRAVGPSVPGTATATSIAGTWVPQATGFSSLSRAASSWPFTEKGRAAVAATQAARIAARSECVPFGPPALMSLPSTMIVDVKDSSVTFTLDVMNVERVVDLDRPPPAETEPTLLGHSVGRWEGDTLVVETVGFTAHPEGYAFDLPSSSAKRVVERFTLNADRKHLDYEATVEDPEYLAETVTHRTQWDYRPEQKPSGLPCEPEVARRFASDE